MSLPFQKSYFYSLPYFPIHEALDAVSMDIPVKNTIPINEVWVAITEQTPQTSSIENMPIYTLQNQGVRLLLDELLQHLQMQDKIIESDYPYYLKESGYFVCFSHSSQYMNDKIDKPTMIQCALVLCPKNVGIDIELRDVKWKIAQRYFHKNEIILLQQLSAQQTQPEEREQIANSLLTRQWLCNQLWKIKECLIKINKDTLATGMGIDLSFILKKLIDEHVSTIDGIDKWKNSETLGSITLELTKNDILTMTNTDISQIYIDNAHNLVVVY